MDPVNLSESTIYVSDRCCQNLPILDIIENWFSIYKLIRQSSFRKIWNIDINHIKVF